MTKLDRVIAAALAVAVLVNSSTLALDDRFLKSASFPTDAGNLLFRQEAMANVAGEMRVPLSNDVVHLMSVLQRRLPHIFGEETAPPFSWLAAFCEALISENEIRFWPGRQGPRRLAAYSLIISQRLLKTKGTGFKTHTEIGQELGVTGSTIHQYENHFWRRIAKLGESFDLRQRLKQNPLDEQALNELLDKPLTLLPFPYSVTVGLISLLETESNPVPTIRVVLTLNPQVVRDAKNLGDIRVTEINDLLKAFGCPFVVGTFQATAIRIDSYDVQTLDAFLETPIVMLSLKERTRFVLFRHFSSRQESTPTLRHIVNSSQQDLLRIKGFGRKKLNEIKLFLASWGLFLTTVEEIEARKVREGQSPTYSTQASDKPSALLPSKRKDPWYRRLLIFFLRKIGRIPNVPMAMNDKRGLKSGS